MNYKKEYEEKLITAKEAANLVKSGDWVDYSWAAQTPDEIDKELAKRVNELENVNIRGGVLLKKPEIFDADPEGNTFIWNSWHAGGPDRKRTNTKAGFYIPLKYSELPKYYRENIDVDIVFIQVPPMDNHGYFSFGLTGSHLMAVCEKAKKIVVEVNENMPRALGGFETEIHISKVDAIVEGNNNKISELPITNYQDIDRKAAEYVVNEITNGACLQLGIGAMPRAVGDLIAESDLKDLGIHSELYVDSFVEMYENGKITGAYKNIDRFRQTHTFAAGTQKVYEFIDNNPQCMMGPVDYVNNPRVIAQIDNFVAINTAVNVDLWGQVSSESAGLKHISGAGGQLDFTLGSYMSRNGKGFICLTSKFLNKKTGEYESRITPNFKEGSIITVPRPVTQYIVTENGIYNCKGKSTWERAEGIINLAAPEFRDDLIKQADEMGIWKNSNK